MNYLWWHWAPFNSQYKASTHSLNRTQSHAYDLETHFHELAFIKVLRRMQKGGKKPAHP